MASAVAIDVAIVATHFKIDTTTFFETFILLFTYGFYGLYGLFTLHYSLLPYLVSFARYGRAALGVITTARATALGILVTSVVTAVSITLRLQTGIVGLLEEHILDAGAVLKGVQVVVTDNQGVGVALMEVFQEPAEGCLLLGRPCVGGLTADVEPAFITDANGVTVMVQTVGSYHPLRTTWLDLSVTTDDVMVADTKLVMSVTAMPGVDLSDRGCLVGPNCRTMNNQQCNCSHNANHY